MLSFTMNSPNPSSISRPHLLHSSFLHHPLPQSFSHKPHPPSTPKPISATLIPANPPPPQQKLYQPFRPPPSPVPPQFRNLDTNGRLEILANRLGLWFEYAPLIPTLVQEGFAPPTIEEITGISGVEQNRLVVGAQVRESLVQSNVEADIIEYFDKGGAELLYEIRLLSANQRAEAARYMIENKLDPKGAQELARAMKDYPRRRGDRGWSSFDYNLPGDCLSFMYYRQALEYEVETDRRRSTMERALEVAVSEKAKSWVSEEMEGSDDGAEGRGRSGGEVDGVKVPVVRLNLGEIAEATVVVVLPVCAAEEREGIEAAPWECGAKGDFGIVEAEKEWRKWVVLPAWAPVAGLKRGGVAVAFPDARALPWRVNKWYKEEPILVVADRGSKGVEIDDGFYLVLGGDGGLKVERGLTLKENGVAESLGTVMIVVRPPREEDDNQLADEDWD